MLGGHVNVPAVSDSENPDLVVPKGEYDHHPQTASYTRRKFSPSTLAISSSE